MPENKTAVVNLGTGMIYKIVVPDPEQPDNIEIYYTNADGITIATSVYVGGEEA